MDDLTENQKKPTPWIAVCLLILLFIMAFLSWMYITTTPVPSPKINLNSTVCPTIPKNAVLEYTKDGHPFIDCKTIWVEKKHQGLLLCDTNSLGFDVNYAVIRIQELTDYNEVVAPGNIDLK